MASLEDKLLGEKSENYCSSSDESDEEGHSDSEGATAIIKQSKTSINTTPCDTNKWEGTSTNTGPKGVINDWQQYKKLEYEKRNEIEKQSVKMIRKLNFTVQSALDEEEERKKEYQHDDFDEFLVDDEFMAHYQRQRMKEMLEQANPNIKFGKLFILKTTEEFLATIDNEHKSVTIIINIHDDKNEACCAMIVCLQQLCKIYENVKFCSINANIAGMSKHFINKGIPALLIYKSGQLMTSFVGISNDFGNDFQPEDIQGLLIEHGFLDDKNCTPSLIQNDDIDSE